MPYKTKISQKIWPMNTTVYPNTKKYGEIGTWPDKQSMLEFMTLFLNYRLHAHSLI